MSPRKRLMLIDGHALAYRAYHAIPPLTNDAGEPTNATFGYINMLMKAIQDYAPDYVVATFDAGKTFRHEEYVEYKATRAATPDDMRVQMGRIHEFTTAMGIPIYEKPGFEADDLLGTLALQASRQGLETIIVTGDSDTFQLITDTVKVLTPRRTFGEIMLYDETAVRERYQLEPRQLIDFKALKGDSSDNIPGVKGIGEKSALALLQQFRTLEGIYAHLDEVTPARAQKALTEGRDDAFRSQHLVTIVQDVDVRLDLEHSEWGAFDRGQVLELLRELGFRTLAERIPQPRATLGEQLDLFGRPAEPAAAEPKALGDYRVVNTPETLAAMTAALNGAPRLALDTETTGVDPMRDELVGISLCAAAGTAYYLPVGHRQRLEEEPQLRLDEVRPVLAPILADAATLKVMHNAKFDMMVLAQHGLPVQGPLFDTMLAAWLLAPSGRGIGLKEQAFERLGVEMTNIQELIGRGAKRRNMDEVAISQAAPYAAADADMTFQLGEQLGPELRQRGQWALFDGLEMPLLPVLLEMETHGMAVDAELLQRMSKEMGQRLAELNAQICDLAGHSFNINSPKQLGVVLFEELGLPVARRTATGYSTDVAVLEELRGKHAIIDLLLEYRQLDKLRGTYVDALPALINPRTGRVHTSFNQTGTSTGRLSSSDPNLQNIPVRSELGRQVRQAFVAPPGRVLLGCDYSQVELRLLAHFSQDPEMLAAFRRDEDVHATTAAAVFGVPLEQVTYEQRSMAKAINFGLMYGMGGYGLSSRTDLSVAEAREFIDVYFKRFSRVKEYLDGTIAFAAANGYVETIMGRRRYFPELAATGPVNQAVRRAAERAAVNMPIQGSAADIIKVAMIRLAARLREEKLRGFMVLQVHDELVLEVPDEELAATRDLVTDTMEHAHELTVRLKVDVSVGKNWMEMK